MNLKKHAIFPGFEKVKYWLKLITVTGTAQIIVQAVGFLSGILVIRLLSVDEYALYTLANTMLGTMTVLSDGGISTGVMAQGGKVWQDRQKLGAVLATGLDMRRKFAIFSLIVSIPILAYLLLQHGANWVTAALITASLIPAFYAALSDTLLQIPVKLHQAIVPLQRNQVEVGVGRLLLTGITLFAFPWAFVAIIASGIPRIWGNVRLRKIASRVADREQKPDAEDRKEILKIVRKSLPVSIYYAFSGQISVWLISVFGKTTAVAQLGALGRISVVLSFFSIIFHTLITPRFAKTENDKMLLLKIISLILFFLFLFTIGIVGATHFFADTILNVLGSEYKDLHLELLLNIFNSSLMLVSGTIYSLYTSKGWILHPIISVGVNIFSVIMGIIIYDISLLKGILQYNIFLTTTQIIIVISYCLYKILNIKT
jgi:O-antigen/teichoic acid export membrane protein